MLGFLKWLFSKFPVNLPPYYTFGEFLLDLSIRISLLVLYGVFELLTPFKRKIHPEEVWRYKNPRIDSYFSTGVFWEIAIVLPSSVIFIIYTFQQNKHEMIQAFLAFSLSLTLNGALTNILKVIVGRPRPDYYYRCFPDGNGNDQFTNCTGDVKQINDGLKSFPSGHSSAAFASLGFLSLYLAGKLHLFTPRGKGTTWKLMIFVLPLFLAMVIAVSRTCDYHHHWQDVLCGSILGFGVGWLCYHNYYPPLYSEKCHIPWSIANSRMKASIKDI